jgi:hypothetical protein
VIEAFGANHHPRQSLVFLNVPTMQQPEGYIGHTEKLFDEHIDERNYELAEPPKLDPRAVAASREEPSADRLQGYHRGGLQVSHRCAPSELSSPHTLELVVAQTTATLRK